MFLVSRFHRSKAQVVQIHPKSLEEVVGPLNGLLSSCGVANHLLNQL